MGSQVGRYGLRKDLGLSQTTSRGCRFRRAADPSKRADAETLRVQYFVCDVKLLCSGTGPAAGRSLRFSLLVYEYGSLINDMSTFQRDHLAFSAQNGVGTVGLGLAEAKNPNVSPAEGPRRLVGCPADGPPIIIMRKLPRRTPQRGSSWDTLRNSVSAWSR